MIKSKDVFLEDFERIADIETIYIQEQHMLEEQEFYEWMRNREAIIEAKDEEGNSIEILIENKLPF